MNNLITQASRPMMIAGSSMFERRDGDDLHKLLLKLADKGNFINKSKTWNGFNVLHKVIKISNIRMLLILEL